jgi:glycerol-3-phosphate dehydrogenase
MAPRVAELMAEELGRDTHWQQQQIEDFQQLAKSYIVD